MTLTVTPSQNAELGTGDPIVDVEAFVDGQLLGGFRKMDIPPIPLHKPHERGYAESEISINPYPPKQGINSTVSTVVQNNSEVTQTVIVDFGWAKFGMGIPFTNTGMTPVSTMVKLGPYMTQTASTTWQPTLTGHQCVLIELTDPDNIYDLQVSQRNVDVEDRPPCGETKVFTFTVYNDSGFVATVDIGMITFNVPSNWQVTVTPSSTMTLQPFSSGIVTVTVKIPCSSPSVMSSLSQIQLIQEEAGSTPTVDVEGYVSGTLVGGIELQFKGSTTNEWKIYLPLVLK
ncbi:MAG: hypothetical protein KKD28_04600 [Chloroflexi bacterium]|nr:hypothetical protein [Chloroflexota bacterium]